MDADKLQKALSRLEQKQLLTAASRIVGFKLRRGLEYGSAANVSGVRDRSFSFSSRLDSRTVFALAAAYGTTKQAGVWTGADKPLIAKCWSAMKAAGIRRSEVASVRVVSEFGASAEYMANGRPRVTETKLLRKEARARRETKGLPVWSSSATIGLTAAGKIGRLELHWPDLPAAVVREAEILRTIVQQGFKPPDVRGATVESVEAGIIHSPIVGFFIDIAPVIRVIYRNDDPSTGRKPTLFLDRHGQAVAQPRAIELAPRDPKPRGEPDYTNG